ncbi:MAG: hypothetical protein M1818_005349 [Claussenomyces sp. TS43310]|nr:MAG: hypothetical protein M1818_005349 [Claussenomyces sp. TS43310]
MEDESDGLLAIDISSDETPPTPKAPRDQQTAADFLAVKASWRPKIEQGEIYKTFQLPINNPTKQQSQAILHAIEELYFYRRYDEATSIAEKALVGELTQEFRRVLTEYRDKCYAKKDLGQRE